MYFVPTISSTKRPFRITVFVDNFPSTYGDDQAMKGTIVRTMRSIQRHPEELHKHPYEILILPEQTITVIIR